MIDLIMLCASQRSNIAGKERGAELMLITYYIITPRHKQQHNLSQPWPIARSIHCYAHVYIATRIYKIASSNIYEIAARNFVYICIIYELCVASPQYTTLPHKLNLEGLQTTCREDASCNMHNTYTLKRSTMHLQGGRQLQHAQHVHAKKVYNSPAGRMPAVVWTAGLD